VLFKDSFNYYYAVSGKGRVWPNSVQLWTKKDGNFKCMEVRRVTKIA